MKGTRRSKVWLALGLVAMACLVLAGCPHNNLLDNSGTGGGNGAGGSRGGSDGVQLVITNFVSEAPTASQTEKRSASWLSGPQRTIAPEHIDLTEQDRIGEYIFVAYGYGSGVYGPEIIDIVPNSGTAGLNIQGSGEWEITVEAYDWKKLQAAGVGGTDKADIIAQNKADPKQITDKKMDAMVLSGSGLVDLGSGTHVSVTLTNDRVTADGEVDIAVKFVTQTDVAKIFAPASPYVVTAELRNLVTQDGYVSPAGESSTVTMFATAGKPGGPVDTDPVRNYQYDKYDLQTGQYSSITVETDQGNTKVLRYNPQNNASTNLKIPRGKYGLFVKVVNTDDNSELYRADWDVSVDGNRVTKGVFEIKDLLGTTPTKPAGLKAYWTKPTTRDQLEGYNATFRWGSSDFYAVGYTLEIANVTSIYEHRGGGVTHVVTTGGSEAFTDAETLWEILDNPAHIDVPTREKLVTTLDWRTTPQEHLEIPRWMEGSLLGTSTSITLRLSTGNVYTARIRADNGTKNFSVWTYVGEAITPPPTFPGVVPQPTEFDFGNTNGIFDLLKFTYDLGGHTDMWGLTANRDGNFEVDINDDTEVADEALLQVEQYEPGNPTELIYSFDGDIVSAKQSDYVLTAVGSQSIVRSWLGWKNTKNGAGDLFGPASGPKAPAAAWTKDDWVYDGHSDLVLIPVGAGGSSINVKVETAGTFAVLDLDTIGFNITTAPTTTSSKIIAGLTEYNSPTQAGVYKNTVGDKLVLVMERVTTQNPVQFTDMPFFVSVGDKNAVDNTVKDTLTDKNGNPIKVTDVSVTVEKNEKKLKYSSGFTTASTGVKPAYSEFSVARGNGLAGMGSGQYTLRVKISIGQGYEPEFQLPMYILYLDQVAATPNIP